MMWRPHFEEVSMHMHWKVAMLVLAVSFGFSACKKVEPEPIALGDVGSVNVPFKDAIPREYGRLVGVSPEDDGWNSLWFEKSDGTITAVGVNWIEHKMLLEAAVISRR
jgi:hypothetical protein